MFLLTNNFGKNAFERIFALSKKRFFVTFVFCENNFARYVQNKKITYEKRFVRNVRIRYFKFRNLRYKIFTKFWHSKEDFRIYSFEHNKMRSNAFLPKLFASHSARTTDSRLSWTRSNIFALHLRYYQYNQNII